MRKIKVLLFALIAMVIISCSQSNNKPQQSFQEYKIIGGETADLEAKVSAALKEGWSLIGGVATHTGSSYKEQAVAR